MAEPRLGTTMSPKLIRVAERAKNDPQARFNSLAHLIDVDALKRSFVRIRNDAAVGVDGVTKEAYGKSLESNLQALHERLRAGLYRHRPIRRVHIPKAPGKTRPIGVSCIEDKLVQGALYEVMAAVYEQDFSDCSYGFRPKRSAHDALRAVNQMVFFEKIGWILEADIASFFDSLDRTKLMEILRERIADGALLRLIGKCLRVGVIDGEEFTRPDEGTVQGSIISPLLGNVYLHHVLDQWFEDMVGPILAGRARLVRYADDFVIGFTRKDDAEMVTGLLIQRFAAYGLTLQPDKTRLIPFRRPSQKQTEGKGPGTFDLLGFTLHWRRGRKSRWILGLKTRTARYRKAIVAIHDWCRSHRHYSLNEQHAGLSRRLRGHFNYFGVTGNARRLHQLRKRAERIWFKWLRRRSQRARRLDWKRFDRYLAAHPLPQPTIRVRIWAPSP
jgi:group II intron reverse transcriptase/maturase